MTGWDSAWLIVLAEALLVLLSLALTVAALWYRRRKLERSALQDFIDRLDEATPLGNKALSEWLGRCGLSQGQIEGLLSEVNHSERALYQSIVALLFSRDMTVLQELEQSITQLPEPYLRALETLSQTHNVTSFTPVADHTETLTGLESVNEQLRHQLDTAIQTIDTMSAEYTRVFSGQQTELELENSCKRLLQIFREAEQQLSHSAEKR